MADGQHPNSRANLRPPWKPGESGNPAGRPSRPSFEELVQEVLDKSHGEGSEITKREVLAEKFVDTMLTMKAWAIREGLKRLWTERQMVEITTPEGEPFRIDQQWTGTQLADVLRLLIEAGMIPQDALPPAPTPKEDINEG